MSEPSSSGAAPPLAPSAIARRHIAIVRVVMSFTSASPSATSRVTRAVETVSNGGRGGA